MKVLKDVNNAIDYTYDVNGNMIKDLNKGITNISYNHLNLPTRVTIGGKNIDYTYDAVGIKLSKTVRGVARQYAGNYVYENGVLQFFNHPRGMCRLKMLVIYHKDSNMYINTKTT
ncbi:hypothetical protein V2550_03100 [Tenacibaculum maritimum]|uniref:hypothetical protein n=1 Tax=Tenacibaculum maritimum TaxID=107401 RepID=UPI0038776FEC